MRALSLFALAVPLTVCVGCGSAETTGQPEPDAGGGGAQPTAASFVVHVEPFVIREATSGEHLAFPDVARLADGRLLLAYRQAGEHGVDPTGLIAGQIGQADGTTWAAPITLLDVPDADDRDPSLFVLASGEVLLSYFQYVYEATADGELSVHQVFVARSRDPEAGFGPPALVPPDVAMTYPGAQLADELWVDATGHPVLVTACSSPMVRVGERLLLPSYGGHPWNSANPAAPRSRLTLYASDDDGASWSAEPVAPELAPDTWLQEPSLLALDAERWILHLRTADGASPGSAGALWQSRTSDGGQGWEPYAPFGLIGHAPYLARLSSGVIISAFRELNDALTQANVSFVYSLDGGASWSEPVRIRPWQATEVGYPSVLELDDGRVIFVYYVGGTRIEAVVYRVLLGY